MVPAGRQPSCRLSNFYRHSSGGGVQSPRDGRRHLAARGTRRPIGATGTGACTGTAELGPSHALEGSTGGRREELNRCPTQVVPARISHLDPSGHYRHTGGSALGSRSTPRTGRRYLVAECPPVQRIRDDRRSTRGRPARSSRTRLRVTWLRSSTGWPTNAPRPKKLDGSRALEYRARA